MFFVEFADGVHHFVDVRDALVGSKFVILAQEVLVARIGDNAFGKNRERSLPRCQQILPALNQVRKALELRGGAARAVRLGHKHLPEIAFAVTHAAKHSLHARLPDGTRRSVDNAQVRRVVFLVGEQAQVREDVLDFLAVPEARTPENDGRDAAVVQCFFNHAGLRVGAVENRRLGIKIRTRLEDGLGNLLGLASVVHHVAHANRVTGLFLREHLLFHLGRADIVGNHGTRTLHDIARGAVIAFELYDSHRGKIAVEVADDADVRAAPAVNTLVIVTHHRHVLVFVYQQFQQFVLHVVRVLILVHHHELELVLELFY